MSHRSRETLKMVTAEIFSEFQKYLDEDQDRREEIRQATRDLEQTAREILITVQAVHQKDGLLNLQPLCGEVNAKFKTVQEKFKALADKIPQGQYYRFHDHWRFVVQRLSFLASFVIYLSAEKLASREEVANSLGVELLRENGFHIDLDDYLMGLLQMASELVRIPFRAVNSVTAGQYDRPLKISQFLAELDAGFRLLNLKNDSLRKRFDGLKYDIKKVEEVVYDLSIRNLVSSTTSKGLETEASQSSPVQAGLRHKRLTITQEVAPPRVTCSINYRCDINCLMVFNMAIRSKIAC
ncbi:translin-like [Liolophura sinensis]|uniref:translin-like n=1 Tax=Liolophura sinensis TaxID=3198878 RepID=UPI00315908EC